MISRYLKRFDNKSFMNSSAACQYVGKIAYFMANRYNQDYGWSNML